MRRYIALCALLVCLTASADENDGQSVSFSKTIEMKVAQETSRCVASASLDYFQRGTEAQIEATIDTEDCAAASGDFVVEATIRVDGTDEAEKLRFPETWRRDDDSPVALTRRYAIGDNADLLRIRIRKLSCECAAPDNQPGDEKTD